MIYSVQSLSSLRMEVMVFGLPTVAFVQDIVHVAVKLKSKLLKPSVLLPMGRYLAGIQHLQMIQMSFGKDEHGLREKDIDYKDKQDLTQY